MDGDESFDGKPSELEYACGDIHYQKSWPVGSCQSDGLHPAVQFYLTVELDSMQSALEIIGSARESARLRKFTFVKYVNSIQCSECVVKNLWTLGGMQIFVSGMVGEYIAKIYTEVKRRPRYFIWEELK